MGKRNALGQELNPEPLWEPHVHKYQKNRKVRYMPVIQRKSQVLYPSRVIIFEAIRWKDYLSESFSWRARTYKTAMKVATEAAARRNLGLGDGWNRID